MVFSSFVFLWIFFPVVLAGYYISNDKIKNLWLLLASLVFYAWGEPKYIILILISVIVNYCIGLLIERSSHKKPALLLGILFNVGLLFFFKYFSYIYSLIYHQMQITANAELLDIALPIGISFYTFQSLSYLIDLYRGRFAAQKNILSLALYITFFPQLIAGPIVRYIDIEYQINKKEFDRKQFTDGMARFSYGLGKKVILANNMGGVLNNIDLLNMTDISAPIAWIGALCYTLQIYFDFSGYSDMAIGLGKMFRFEFNENFNLPYTSRSISEFWRRWHISLGTWFREYVYIPLGGNRKGKVRTYVNLLIVFTLTGIWHGANITFLIWGLYYGVLIVLERHFIKKEYRWKNIIGLIYTLFFVNIGWVIFRNDSLLRSLAWIKRMVLPWRYTVSNYNVAELMSNTQVLLMVVGIFFCGFVQYGHTRLKECILIPVSVQRVAQFSLIFISLLMLAGSSYNPFIYFRF